MRERKPAGFEGFLFTPYNKRNYGTRDGNSSKSPKLLHPVPNCLSTPSFLFPNNNSSCQVVHKLLQQKVFYQESKGYKTTEFQGSTTEFQGFLS